MLTLFPSSYVNVSSSLRTWAWLLLPWISPQSQLIYTKYIPSLGKNFLSWKTRASTHIVYCLSPSLHSTWQYEIISFVSLFDLKLSAMFSQFSHSVVSSSLWPHEPQHARSPCSSPTPGVHTNPCPWSLWCHTTISSSVILFSSCPQSIPALGSFQMSQLFPSDGQGIGVSASASVLPMNTQDWSPSGWTGWISLQSKGLPKVFSNSTVRKHQFFSTQLSLSSNSHIHTWPLKKT